MPVPDKAEPPSLDRRRPAAVSPRRDRIGRSVARILGVAAVAGGVVAAFKGHSIRDRVVPLITGASFASWIFYIARTTPGPGADDSEGDS